MPDVSPTGEPRRRRPGQVHAQVVGVHQRDPFLGQEPAERPSAPNLGRGDPRKLRSLAGECRQIQRPVPDAEFAEVGSGRPVAVEDDNRLESAAVERSDKLAGRNMTAAYRIPDEGKANTRPEVGLQSVRLILGQSHRRNMTLIDSTTRRRRRRRMDCE